MRGSARRCRGERDNYPTSWHKLVPTRGRTRFWTLTLGILFFAEFSVVVRLCVRLGWAKPAHEVCKESTKNHNNKPNIGRGPFFFLDLKCIGPVLC